MNKQIRLPFILIVVAITTVFLFTVALADDGQMFRRNISKTPDGETEKAFVSMMSFYVPVQGSDGTLLTAGVPYYDAAGALVDTRYYAKPLVSSYIDGIEVDGEETSFSIQGTDVINSGVTFGHRDAFVAVSLDDGSSWKNFNLSRSADLSSFMLSNGHPYPGDVHNMVHVVAGDRILAAWLSKYCDGGTPLYTYTPEEALALETTYGLTHRYVTDLFEVSGNQGSVNYTEQGFPEVGEIPYTCVWIARGKLVNGEYDGDPLTPAATEVLWSKAERLTSGRRDANVLSVDGVPGAGFILVWQEDPDGLRPGQGLGPGEGWSGAIVHQKTDMWYSYIDWDHFDLVSDVDELGTPTAVPIELFSGTTTPKVAIPAAMPLRLTDNNMCKADPKYDTTGELLTPYCYYDFETDTQYIGANSASDFCAESISWTNPGGTTLNVCRTQDGRTLTGRTGASRTRLTLTGYDSDGDYLTDSAWVVMAYEETKALGYTEVEEEEIDPIDIGKNEWYHSFDMFHPDLVSQGGILNQPEVDRATLAFYPLETDEFGFPYYRTEIARRFALMTQPTSKLYDATNGTYSGSPGILIYKQGIINQGGPADIFLRRLVLPVGFNPLTDNPYAYENMECAEKGFTDGSNPNYVKGICLSPAINISGTTIVACDNGTSGSACADTFPWDGGTNDFPKVTDWIQTPDNLDDQSWENPFDVAKGHRGFIDGNFVMVMYAWAPNWKANTVGNDHYNLYVRRSFDGGMTWTTTPDSLGGDGTTSCEWYGLGGDATETCTTYAAGAFEQARNVSQLVGNKITILDPRYTPAGGLKQIPYINTILTDTGLSTALPSGLPYWDDAVRDPSRFFIVYETGDNTTVAEGEAIPLDLFYSRAYDYGDDYDLIDYYKDKDNDGTAELVQEWGWLENKQEDLSGEASVMANPGATYLYSVWSQWQELEEDVVSDSDNIFRRVMYIDTEDGLPVSSILYTSHTRAVGYNAGTLTFIATASDSDHLGDAIVSYEWVSSLDGVLGTEQELSIPASSLSIGNHTISVSAQDGEGNWTTPVTFDLYVAENLYQMHLPMLQRAP